MTRAEYLKKSKKENLKGTFCRIFADTVKQFPENIAVCADNISLTYRKLTMWAEAAAHKLLVSGVKKGDIIAIRTGRTGRTIAGILGIWKAGCAYVYLDNAYPKERCDSIIEECQCRVILTDEWWADVDVERDYEPVDYSENEGLALIIYTSGSTSRPKGVMLTHRNVVAACYNFDSFGNDETTHYGLFAGLGFVAAMGDITAALAVGSTLYIVPSAIRKNITELADFYEKNDIAITFLPPHMARKLLALGRENIPLKLLLVGSEAVRNLGKAPFKIFNIYGASEACSMIAHYEVTGNEDKSDIYPVGKLNPDLKGYIVDDTGKPVKPGKEGELWLSGPQISKGYYCMPEKTAKQFITNPFTREKGYEKVFKTNDLVRELPDGNLEYVCRKDNMFKIRGFRVECSAVESALMECGHLKEAVVLAFMDKGGCNILCGYIVADYKVDVKALKEKMKEKVPYYMVPTCIIQLDAFPRNVNSKIDRKAILPPKELDDHKLLEKLY